MHRLHLSMTFSEAVVQRDTDGRFAEKVGAPAEVSLTPVFEKYEVRGVKAGDLVDTEGSNPDSPFQFAFMRNATYRKALRAAGYPNHLRVISAGRASDDGHTDNAIVFDIGGQPVELTFHRDREMLVSPRNQE